MSRWWRTGLHWKRTRKELEAALEKVLGTTEPERQVAESKQKKALVDRLDLIILGQHDIERLGNLRHIHLGYVTTSVRKWIKVQSCHKRLRHTHVNKVCEGLDNSITWLATLSPIACARSVAPCTGKRKWPEFTSPSQASYWYLSDLSVGYIGTVKC